MPDLVYSGAVQSGAQAFAGAGLSVTDVDVAMLYDAFTINPILFLEDLGFCKKGEGGQFVSGGRIAPGGELAVNTNGGGLSYRSEEHTSELQSLMRISYAVFCLTKQ